MTDIHETILAISPARSGKKLRAFAGVTIHETANAASTATAQNHMLYMTKNGGQNKEVSYHYVVDEREAYHLIPNDEVAWHAGDGAAGKGNNETIAIEICVNSGADFGGAVKNAACLTAALLHERKIKTAAGYIFEHHDFSAWGKSCPARLRAGDAGGMAAFRAQAQKALDEMWGNAPPSAQAPAAGCLWRVQCGAFEQKENAARLAEKLKAVGFDAYILASERN